jgi:hypothetical protein
MTELLRMFVQIALLKRGPQDLPASPTLLAATAATFFVVTFLVYSALPGIHESWRPQLVVQVLYILVSLALLLRVAGRSERYLQTTTAMFGYLTLLSPLSTVIAWMLLRLPGESPVQFPLVIALIAVVAWTIAVGQQVLKAALEWSTLASIVLLILWISTGQLLLIALFPAPPEAAGAPVTPAA